MIEADISPNGRKILWNYALESFFKELKRVFSAEKFMGYPGWKLPFTVHTDSSDKQLCAVISQNNKLIAFFSRRLSKPRRNCTTTDKKLIAILECLKKLQGIIFGYEINVFSYHKNLVYSATLS